MNRLNSVNDALDQLYTLGDVIELIYAASRADKLEHIVRGSTIAQDKLEEAQKGLEALAAELRKEFVA